MDGYFLKSDMNGLVIEMLMLSKAILSNKFKAFFCARNDLMFLLPLSLLLLCLKFANLSKDRCPISGHHTFELSRTSC